MAKNDYSLIYFHANWCGYCRKLETTTLSDQHIVKILKESFNTAKIDVDSDTLVNYYDTLVTCHDLGRKFYRVYGYPTICFFNRRGDYLASLVGYKSPDSFLAALKLLMEVYPTR